MAGKHLVLEVHTKGRLFDGGWRGVGVGSLGSWVVETELTMSDNCMTDDFYS